MAKVWTALPLVGALMFGALAGTPQPNAQAKTKPKAKPQTLAERGQNVRYKVDDYEEQVLEDVPLWVDDAPVPVAEFLDDLFGEQVQGKRIKGKGTVTYQITCTVDGAARKWVEMSVDAPSVEGPGGDTPTRATVYDISGKGGNPIVVPLSSGFFEERGEVYAALNLMAELFACSSLTDQLGDTVVKTPNWWRKRLGLNKPKIPVDLTLLADFGITPAVTTQLSAFVRVRRPCFAQIYRVQDAADEPFATIMRTSGGAYTRRDFQEQDSAMIPLKPGQSWRIVDEFGNVARRTTIGYAILLAEQDLGADPIGKINRGEYKGRWLATGIENDIVPDSPLQYELIRGNGKPAKALLESKEINMAPETFAALNGLTLLENTDPKMSYVFLMDVRPQREEEPTDYRIVGPYFVRPKDSLESLAKKWRVTVEQIVEANDYVAEAKGGTDSILLSPGDLMTQIVGRGSAGTPSTEPDAKPVKGTVTTSRDATLWSSPEGDDAVPDKSGNGVIVPKGTKVQVDWSAKSGRIRVEYKDYSGWIDAKAIEEREAVQPASYATPQRLEGDPRVQKVINFGFGFIGTRYDYGGNSLTKGIDCSHFVQEIYRRTIKVLLPAPVSTQERLGRIVHVGNPSTRRMIGAEHFRDASKVPAQLRDWNQLRPGDRFILQYPSAKYSGRHTGVYLGRRFRYKGRLFEYAILHSSGKKGVNISSLRTRYYEKIYQYSVSGPDAKPRGRSPR